MKKTLFFTFLASLLLFSGCAGNRSNIIIDPAGVDMGKYQKDLAQCQQLARQVKGKAVQGAVGGAIVGGIAGSIVDENESKKKLSRLGALGGALKGGKATKMERERVVKKCLANRGYSVLN